MTFNKLRAGLMVALALVVSAPLAAADHAMQHNLTGNINVAIEGFVPLIVTMALLAAAIGALYNLRDGGRGKK